jgi:phage shock protein A
VGEQMADVGLAMQRALDKTENMKARASAVGELEASGTFEDLTQLGPGKDDIDRQLEAIGAGGAVDDELSRMKAELGSGTPAPAELAAAPEEAPEATAAPSEAAPAAAEPAAAEPSEAEPDAAPAEADEDTGAGQ